MEISTYIEKLNKVDGNIYVIEEEAQLTGGVYEGLLAHDNVNTATLAVWTGMKLTGTQIQSYALSTPSLTPWKRLIRIYADVPTVYISYETDGDTVEAEDINLAQSDLVRTQKAVSAEEVRAEAAEKVLREDLAEEAERAKTAEKVLTDNLAAEVTRSKAAEKTLSDNLSAEVTRAKAAEKTNADNLAAESTRAKNRENEIDTKLINEVSRAGNAENVLAIGLDNEIIRAKAEEKTLTDNLAAEAARAEAEEKDIRVKLSAETTRAENAEKTLTDNLSAEVTRSKGAEKVLTDNLAAETVRAKAAEKTNTDSITAETTRAKAKETELQGKIQTETNRATAAEDAIRSTITTNKPIWDDKYTRNEVDNKFSALESAVDWKESVDNFAAIAKAYPNPQDGWTVNVKDTDYTYRWSGTAWVAISANAIPKATKSVDGLLTKEDKIAYDDANTKKHTHDNKSVIDKITQALLDNWSKAYSHISDAVKHITATERTNWNAAHTHTSNKSNPHGVTAAQAGAAPASHSHSYLPLAGGTMTGELKMKSGEYTATPIKLYAGDANGASLVSQAGGLYIAGSGESAQNLYTALGTGAATEKTYISSDQDISLVTNCQTIANRKTVIIDNAGKITAPGGFSGAYNPSDLSAAVPISKGGTGAATAAAARTNLGAAASSHTHTKSQITDFPASFPANGGTANYANYLNVNNIAANKDLNSVTVPGFYYCPANATVATFKNCPTTNAFFMVVGQHAGVYQKIVEYVVSNPRTFERNFYSNAWGTWKNITVLTPVPAGAKFTDTVYSHPATTGNKHIPAGGSAGQFLKWSADGTAVWAADNNTTYGVVTQSANGLMAAADKKKLDGIATGANNYSHPSTHPASMITQDATHRFVTDTEKVNWNKILFTASVNVPASGWSAGAPYTQTVSVAGLTAAMDIMPTLNITGSSTAAQVAAWKKVLSMIDDGTTANGSITFKCYSKKPAVDIPLYLKSV